VLIVAVGWTISPGLRGWLRRKMMRTLFVLALVVVALGLLGYWNAG